MSGRCLQVPRGIGNGSGQSHANKRRAEQQEALRERLSKGKHLEHVVELLEEVKNLSPEGDKDAADFIIKRNDLVIKHKLSLIKKYIPDLSNLAVQADVEQKTILIDLSGDNESGSSEIQS